MALVTITLRDVDDRLDVRVESEPPFHAVDGEENENTSAQIMALLMLGAAVEGISEDDYSVKAE